MKSRPARLGLTGAYGNARGTVVAHQVNNTDTALTFRFIPQLDPLSGQQRLSQRPLLDVPQRVR